VPILYRYFAKTIALPTLAITSIALAVFSTTRLISILERAVESGIGAEAFLILLLSFPGYLTQVLPLGLFLGVILGVGKLYADQEITALISSGVPNKTLYLGVLIPALGVCMLLWANTLWLAPMSSSKVDEMWRTLTSQTSFDLIKTGEFNKLNNEGMALYVEDQNASSNPTGLFFGDPANMQFLWADSASLNKRNTFNARYFTFIDGYQYIGGPNTASEKTAFDTYSIKIIEPPPSKPRDKAHLLSNKELLERGTRWHTTEFLDRLLWPPIAMVLAVLGLAFSRTKPRQGRFRMVLPAIFTYSIYTVMLSASIRPVYRNQAPYFTAMWWVHLLFLAFAVLLIVWPQISFKTRVKS